MTQDDRIALLAALVHRKWRALTQPFPTPEAKLERLEEWAAASLLLEQVQDAAARAESVSRETLPVCTCGKKPDETHAWSCPAYPSDS